MGQLAATAGQDAVAKQQFADRLATPKLPTADRVYTLQSAVQAFSSNGDDVSRMKTACDYLSALDALPKGSTELLLAQIEARLAIATAYFLAGKGDAALPFYRDAFKRVSGVEFTFRNWNLYTGAFIDFANVVSSLPNGRAEIDSTGARLLALSKIPPELVAQNPDFWGPLGQQAPFFQGAITQTSMLGRRAPDIQAQYWYNAVAPSETSPKSSKIRVKRMDDGKIRVLMIGHYGCPGCLATLSHVDKMLPTLPPNVEAWFVAFENDMWGITQLPADDVAEHYRAFYLDEKKHRMPIALWIGGRVPSPEGGTTTESSPTVDQYDLMGFPTFVVVDGHGRVRSIRVGLHEPTVMRTVKYLVKEASNATTRTATASQ